MVIVDRQLHVQRINEAAGCLLRVSSEAAMGQTLAAVVRDHEVVGVLQAVLCRTGARTQRTCAWPTPAGGQGSNGREEPRYVRVTGHPITGGEHAADPAGLLILQDVTDLRRTEAVREFVANVSHELRTPLATRKALAETLENGALDHPPAAREFLNKMHVEVDSLTQLVHELLDLSRIESGEQDAPERLPPRGAGGGGRVRLRMQAERAGVHSLWMPRRPAAGAGRSGPGPAGADQPPPQRGQVHSRQVRGGAVRPPGGRGGPLRRQRHGQGHRARGPAPHLRAFLQGGPLEGHGGTGLGLAIAKHIVQAHGGEIWASSAGEGQGSSFAFTLPIAAEEAVEAPLSDAVLVLNGGAEAQVSTGVAAARGAR